MKTSLRSLSFAAALLACTALPAIGRAGSIDLGAPSKQNAPAQPMASPAATAEVTLHGKPIAIKYNSPQKRGRVIFGELVPYGQVWRTGANPATSFNTAVDLKIGTLRVPAGSYTLYTLPAAPGTPWTLIVNKQTGQWGTEYHQEQDLGRVPMQAAKLSTPQEGMSLSFEHTVGKVTELHVKWDTTDQWVKVEAK